MDIEAVNETTCIVYVGDQINEATADRVAQAERRIRETMADVIRDLVPSFTSILVCYDPDRIDRLAVVSRLKQALANDSGAAQDEQCARTIELPVYYGPEVALDLDEVCAVSGLSSQDVIRLHSEQTYRVYAIGFSPGFAYLGSVDQRIAIPRKSTPRLRVPAGSVGIAGTQTAIYPSATPGGWQIIGQTPSKMIDWDSDSLALVQVGDRVRFRAIDREAFLARGGRFDEL